MDVYDHMTKEADHLVATMIDRVNALEGLDGYESHNRRHPADFHGLPKEPRPFQSVNHFYFYIVEYSHILFGCQSFDSALL